MSRLADVFCDCSLVLFRVLFEGTAMRTGTVCAVKPEPVQALNLGSPFLNPTCTARPGLLLLFVSAAVWEYGDAGHGINHFASMGASFTCCSPLMPLAAPCC